MECVSGLIAIHASSSPLTKEAVESLLIPYLIGFPSNRVATERQEVFAEFLDLIETDARSQKMRRLAFPDVQ